VEPVHRPVQGLVYRHPKRPTRQEPTRNVENEVARHRPVHYGLREVNARSRLPSRQPRKRTDVCEGTPHERGQRCPQTPARPPLPSNHRKSHRKRQVARTLERPHQDKGGATKDEPPRRVAELRGEQNRRAETPKLSKSSPVQFLQRPSCL
jgi:hypothetical protein